MAEAFKGQEVKGRILNATASRETYDATKSWDLLST